MKLQTQRKAMITHMLAGLASSTALVATLPLALTPSVALAQESAKADSIETIVVTARRREEPLQQVPAAITMFTAQQIEDAGIRTLQDVAALTPNLSFRERYRPGAVSISLRGIASNPQGEAPVTVVVDGVSVPGLDFLNQQLMDLESIQILKGPQGALYGHGAIAGAVLITTKQPGNDFRGGVRLSSGSGRDARLTSTISGPIAKDKVFFSLSGSSVSRGGQIYDTGLKENADTVNEQTFNGHLKALLTDNLSIDIRVKHTDGKWGADLSENVGNNNYLDWSVLPGRNVKDVDRRTIDEQSVALKYKTSAGTLTAVSGFSSSTSVLAGDADFTPMDIVLVRDSNPIKAWSQDIRFASPDNQALRWVIGAFYQNRDSSEDLLVYASPTNVVGMPPNMVLAQDVHARNSKASAVYGQLIYALRDKTEVEGAIRYDADKRSAHDKVPAAVFSEANFSQLQPKVSLKHSWSDSLMTYASYGQGFRSGGFNNQSAVALIAGATRIYPKEVSNTLEIGLKSQFMDRRVTLNVAAFNIDFKNQQFVRTDLATAQFAVLSMKKSSINGFEVEVTARPVRRLELGAAVGVADAVIKDADGRGLWAGMKSPQSYASTMNLSAQYVHPISDRMNLFARMDYERRGKIYFDEPNQFPFPATNFIDARLFLEFGNNSVGLYGRNLTNERTPTDFITPGPPGFAHGRLPNQPRQIGIEANVKF